MKIAVIGSGIAGLAAAHELQRCADVTLFESQNRLGGHTDTHAILAGSRTYAIDSGFMAFDAARSPGFRAWLGELGVQTRATTLSLGVHHLPSGLEYGTGSLGGLFCQWRNCGSPGFLRLVRELVRFYGLSLADAAGEPRSLGDFLESRSFSETFRRLHLLPLCRAIWSIDVDDALDLPAAQALPELVRHRFLPFGGLSDWRVIVGGADSYVAAFVARFSGQIRRGEPVLALARSSGRVVVTTAAERRVFDAVVIACHSHEALGMLEDPSREERALLSALRFGRSRRVVHSDTRVMPHDRRAWSAWNARVAAGASGNCEITFWMNRLLSLPEETPLFVTVDPVAPLESIWSVREYAAPILDAGARAAQSRRALINGVRNTWYCGSWWGAGLQEDGFASGIEVARSLVGAAEAIPADARRRIMAQS